MSDKKCCVPGCSGGAGTQTLHHFPNPAKDMDHFLKWLFHIGSDDVLQLKNNFIFKRRRVCHQHFEKKYCSASNRITNTAVPTINMPGLAFLNSFIHGAEQIQSLPENAMPSSSKDLSPCKPENIQVKRQDSQVVPFTAKDFQHLIAPNPLKEIQNLPASVQCCSASRKRKIEVSNQEKENINLPHLFAPNPLKEIQNLPASVQCCSASRKRKIEVSDQEKENIKTKLAGKTTVTKKLKKKEHDFYIKFMSMKLKLFKYKNKSKKQAMEIKAAKKLLTNTEFVNILENMTKTSKLFTLMQFRENKKKEKGRRYSEQEKILALSIMKQSPKAYRFLRKMFILPNSQTLITLLNKANVRPGINKNIFTQLKSRADKMKIEDRICVLLFDEMSIKPSVTYNQRKDAVSGFVTDGEKTQPILADHAQVFMIRGLIRNYKQPISYSFSSGATKGSELAKQIKININELQNIGFKVLATICDQGTNNRSAIKILSHETRRTFIKSGKIPQENIFLVNNDEIIALYDPPHLLKGIRNNLLTKKLIYQLDGQTKTAKWQHLELLLKENPTYKGVRLITKLTENHIDPKKISKMKVKHATQVFSQTVATNMGYLADKGILPLECRDTADVLLFFDELFDSVNGSYANKKKYGKPLLQAVKPNSGHYKKWMEAIKILKSMKFIKNTGQTENVPTLDNWVWTLKGLQMLVKKLEKQYLITSVWIRHLNQDPLENFFGAIRSHGCRNVNPTVEKFESAFAALLINSLTSVHAPGANCERDYCQALLTLVGSEDCKLNEMCDIDLNRILEINILPLESKTVPQIKAPLEYISGYFVKKARKIFKNCMTCKTELTNEGELEYIKYREYSKQRWLCSPSDSVIHLISAFQDVITEILKENLEKNHIADYVKTVIYILVDFKCFNCTEHGEKCKEFVVTLVIRFFLFNYCKHINKIITGKQNVNDETDRYQKMAKACFNKCHKTYK